MDKRNIAIKHFDIPLGNDKILKKLSANSVRCYKKVEKFKTQALRVFSIKFQK